MQSRIPSPTSPYLSQHPDSWPRRLSKLKEGDPIYVERKSYGFLTTDRFVSGRDLWMLATGTGLAPFLSILHDFQTWESYDNLVLVQSVRTQQELAYEDLIESFDQSEHYAEFAHKLRYVRIVTREPGHLAVENYW